MPAACGYSHGADCCKDGEYPKKAHCYGAWCGTDFDQAPSGCNDGFTPNINDATDAGCKASGGCDPWSNCDLHFPESKCECNCVPT